MQVLLSKRGKRKVIEKEFHHEWKKTKTHREHKVNSHWNPTCKVLAIRHTTMKCLAAFRKIIRRFSTSERNNTLQKANMCSQVPRNQSTRLACKQLISLFKVPKDRRKAQTQPKLAMVALSQTRWNQIAVVVQNQEKTVSYSKMEDLL